MLLVLAILLAAGLATAQSFTATLAGTVKDSTGAMVPNTSIFVVNAATNARVSATSDAAGNYVAPQLPPGQYSIEATASGFKKFVQSGIVLQVQQQARVDITLEVGAVTESVQVTADAALLEVTSSTVGKVVDNRRIVNLPLNTRNVYSLVFLTPGVAGTVGYNYGDMRYSVNGARARTMDTLIDGVTATHATVTGGSGISVFPSVDAIEEFKVMGSNYPAEFGRSQGNVLNVIFKSGTNRLHGSAYEFLRNSALDSNNFFDNSRGRQLASFRRSQFGATASGPIRRDKLFFMGSYEGLRESSFRNRTFTVPTAAERGGDFSRTLAANGQLIRVFDPLSTRREGAGFIRDPFPNNAIPASRFDPVAVNVIRYYPQPNTAGAAVTNQNNYSQSGSGSIDLNQFDARIDSNLSARQRFFARYSHRQILSIPLVSFPRDLTIAEGRITEGDRVRGAVADYTDTLSPTTILTGRLGFARTLYVYDNQSLGFKPSALGLPASVDGAVDRQMFPGFAASDYVGLGGNDHRWNAFMSYTALANLTMIRGSHTLKAGFEGRLMRVNVWEARSSGDFSFNRGMTQGPNPNAASATAGNSIASLLLGTGSGGNLYQNWKNVASQNFYLAGYFQDDWRITRKLTLNLGLRYDIETPRTERYDRMNWFDPAAASPFATRVPGFPNLRGGLVFVGVGGNPRGQYDYDANNFAPRIGLAYQLTPKTVVRAAYGHFFGASPQMAHGTVGPYGFRVENLWVTSIDGITPQNLLRNPYPQGFLPPPGASDGLLTGAGGNIQGMLRGTIVPWTMQWNFNIQRELPGQILVEAAYVANRGLQLPRSAPEGGMNLNQLDPALMSLGARLNDQVDNPFFGIVRTGVLANPRVGRAQLLRPFPQFATVTPMSISGSSSSYHSLQATATKRFSRGLTFEGSYTWAKSIDDTDSHQNSYDTRADRTIASISLAHRFVMSYIYELPFGRGRRFGSSVSRPVDFLLGGWQWNGITSFQSGTPVGISANNTSGIASVVTRANNNGRSGKLSGPVHERLNAYFDRSVFSQPAPFTFGNLTATLPDIRVDGIRNFDLSLFKDFRITESFKTEFRAEFLNAFNTPRFGGPTTGVTSPAFGLISSQANAPRQIQFGLKLLW